jgi:uncharacterized protein DUF3857/transglutaminase superfamily protein
VRCGGINSVVLRGVFVSLLSLSSGACVIADDWLPVNSTDLAAKDSADKPGAHAIYLYREDVRDDTQSHEDIYERIKIFTEEGKQYGDIEIPYYRDVFSITNVRARTIRPDGSTAEWNGKLLDKTVVKARGYKVQEKTFTLPEVEAGCIIEYKYRMALNTSYLYDNTWEIQKGLFTKEAKFSFHASPLYDLVSIPYGVSASTPISKEKDGTMRFDIQNVPALEKEDYMPPEEAVRSRVDFYYTSHGTIDPDKFWKNTGEFWFEGSERYIGHRKAISEEVGRTVGPDDSPETKLRKLYARVQMIRNTSFEREKTIQEVKRENQKANDNVEDVLKHGVGNGVEIDYLFCGLARAAGFEASVVRVSTRNVHFFTKTMLEANKLNDVVISVKLGDKDVYLDPGNAHAPYGLLPWSETGVQGLKLDKDGGQFVTTTSASPDDAVTKRVGKLVMADDGLVNGRLTVTYTGQEALYRRLEADENDDAQRAKSLIDEVKALVPAGATVELTNSPDWNGPDAPLVAEFDVKSRAWGTQTGRRLLVSQSFFSHPVARQFEHPSRTYPIYFDYPYTDLDDITLQLPLALHAASLPATQVRTNGLGFYEISSENQGASLRLVRKMGVSGILYPAQSYAAIRNFFNQVRAGDEQQIVLEGSK